MTLLSNELAGDPQALGYAGLSDAQAADLLNLKNRPYLPDRITPAQLLSALDIAEYDALALADRRIVDFALGVYGELDLSAGASLRREFFRIFGGGNTAANLMALARRSRAEELGLGAVTRRDVALARRA